MVLNLIMIYNKIDLLKRNINIKYKLWGKKRKLFMLFCIWNLDFIVDEVVIVKISGVVVELVGVL